MKKNYPCQNKNIRAHITERKQKDGTTVLYGYPIDAETHIRIDNCRPHQLKAKKMDDIDATRKYLTNIINSEYDEKNNRKNNSSQNNKEGYFSNAFAQIKNKLCLCSGTWGDSTSRRFLVYFERQILPKLDVYGVVICSEDLAALRDELIAHAASSNRGYRNPDQAASSVAPYVDAGNRIYNAMKEELADSYYLPEIDIAGNIKRSKVQPEQCKSLPNDVRVKIAAILFRMTDLGLSMGVALMLFCGLRPAEAAAVMIGSIIIRGSYGVLPIHYQIKDGKRTAILKTAAAYRVVKLPYIAVVLIEAYKKHLINLGFNEDQIETMPLVSRPESPDVYITGSEISAFGRKVLLAAGCTKEYLISVEINMKKEPDFDVDGLPLRDVTAYIIRRDWCSRVSDICGFKREDVDYNIGHATDIKHEDYITPEACQKVAAQLERFVFLPQYSLNAAYKPLVVTHGTEVDLLANMSFEIIADSKEEEIEICLDISCLEPGYPIMVTIPRPAKSVDSKRANKDTPEARSVRPILGRLYSNDYYERLILEAELIDLSKLTSDGGI